jgi:hypothetical protein
MSQQRLKFLLALIDAPGELLADVLGVTPPRAIEIQIDAAAELMAFVGGSVMAPDEEPVF